MRNELPSHELISRLLTYDPETGKLYWLSRTPDMFDEGTGRHSRQHTCDTWNTKNAFQEAGTMGTRGYRQLHLSDGARMRAHRVIWFMMTKKWPENVDHINGQRDDNRWVNLRAATKTENARNAKRNRLNTSGAMGVSFNKGSQKWQAYGSVNNRRIWLGRYATKDEAAAVRTAWAKSVGYHPNHDRPQGPPLSITDHGSASSRP